MWVGYDWRTLDGYQCPIRVAVGRRGLGKTFTKVLAFLRSCYASGVDRFVYVVENDEMVKELARNGGDKFFSRIIEFLKTSKKRIDKSLLDALQTAEVDVVDMDVKAKIVGGAIFLGAAQIGYILSWDAFARIKRTNFINVRYYMIDEFVPETVDIRALDIPRKVVSIVQSISRNDPNAVIYMAGNSIRSNDLMLERLGLANMKPGEIRTVKDKYGVFVVGEMIDNSKYPEFMEVADKSVAGRLARLLGEDNLDRNRFRADLPPELAIPPSLKPSKFFYTLCGGDGVGSVRVHRILDGSGFYVMTDYGKNESGRICFDKKFASGSVRYMKEFEQLFFNQFMQNRLFFDCGTTFIKFKLILKLDTK